MTQKAFDAIIDIIHKKQAPPFRFWNFDYRERPPWDRKIMLGDKARQWSDISLITFVLNDAMRKSVINGSIFMRAEVSIRSNSGRIMAMNISVEDRQNVLLERESVRKDKDRRRRDDLKDRRRNLMLANENQNANFDDR
jgi:hypothetical protein